MLPPMTLARLRAKVESFGGRLEDDSSGDACVYQCVAPDGHVWSSSPDLATMIVHWTRGVKEDRRLALLDAFERVSGGVEPGEPTP